MRINYNNSDIIARFNTWKKLVISTNLRIQHEFRISNYAIAVIWFCRWIYVLYHQSKPMMYGFVIGGWTVGVYFIQLLWDNIRLIGMHYQNHVISYVIFTGLLSFIVCYRLGPVTDQRTKNLIKWALQGSGLSMIFFSSHYQEATVAIIVIILVTFNFPETWTSKMKAYWKRKFPPKTRLLTEDEYHEQGVRETAKALHELRGYCSSPDCNAWKTVLRLKEPVRFANFMNGSSHLSDNEILAYESESRRTVTGYYTDDESGSEYSEDY